MTVTERCTSSAYPCADSQSGVVDVLLAPSTDRVELMIDWSVGGLFVQSGGAQSVADELPVRPGRLLTPGAVVAR